jgi:SAM-dependent methyltransferase
MTSGDILEIAVGTGVVTRARGYCRSRSPSRTSLRCGHSRARAGIAGRVHALNQVKRLWSLARSRGIAAQGRHHRHRSEVRNDRRAKSHPGLERVRWHEADALALPFGDHLFNCVLYQFGVMFFLDKQSAVCEILRVLKPGCRFLFSVWGTREGSIWQVATAAVGQFLSRDPASLVSIVRERYPDFGPSLAAEKLAEHRR